MLLRPPLLSLLVLALPAACDEKKAVPPPASAEAPAGPPRPRMVTGAQAREAVANGAAIAKLEEWVAAQAGGVDRRTAGEARLSALRAQAGLTA